MCLTIKEAGKILGKNNSSSVYLDLFIKFFQIFQKTGRRRVKAFLLSIFSPNLFSIGVKERIERKKYIRKEHFCYAGYLVSISESDGNISPSNVHG